MKILLKQVQIADPNSTYNGQHKDILITDGTIDAIADNLSEADELIQGEKLLVTPGWVDIFVHFNDPGYEQKETLISGAAAAVAGGYTHVFVLPNTKPVTDSKTQVAYLNQKTSSLPVTIHALGALTKAIEGNQLAEMYDMYASGAVGFTDGLLPVQSSGLLLKALQYVKAFAGVVIQLPMDRSIGEHGLINEGIVSTRLGLPGIPAMAEEIIVARDIKLLRYADSKLHFTGVSTAKSLEYIKRGKDAGLNLSCSVSPHHLFFCDEDVSDYDTNLKVTPPLRTREDMMALREAVATGVVDCISSHHFPQEWDAKTCEFEYAKAGMIGLQTAYATIRTVLPDLDNNRLAALFSGNARKIFGLGDASIQVGNQAELTLVSKEQTTCLTKSSNLSKSSNSPFLDKVLQGKVIGIINKGSLYLNQ